MIHRGIQRCRKLIRKKFAFCFSERLLQKYFKYGNENQFFSATYDVIDVSEQTEVTQIRLKNPIGIVIQGPINRMTTLRFCKFIRATYPSVKVVLSTWEGEDLVDFIPLVGESFLIIQSKKPSFAGPSNINMQIVSTHAGIKALVDLGCVFTLKTRTDVFLSNPQFLNYLSWCKAQGEPSAIVFSSFNSFLFRFFSVTDQVMFGTTVDMVRYWSIDIVSNRDFVGIPEVYLFQKYLASQRFESEESLTSYLSALKQFAVIADHEQLGQVWNKGAFTSLGYRWRGGRFPHPMSPLSYWLWDEIGRDGVYVEELYKSLN